MVCHSCTRRYKCWTLVLRWSLRITRDYAINLRLSRVASTSRSTCTDMLSPTGSRAGRAFIWGFVVGGKRGGGGGANPCARKRRLFAREAQALSWQSQALCRGVGWSGGMCSGAAQSPGRLQTISAFGSSEGGRDSFFVHESFHDGPDDVCRIEKIYVARYQKLYSRATNADTPLLLGPA